MARKPAAEAVEPAPAETKKRKTSNQKPDLEKKGQKPAGKGKKATPAPEPPAKAAGKKPAKTAPAAPEAGKKPAKAAPEAKPGKKGKAAKQPEKQDAKTGKKQTAKAAEKAERRQLTAAEWRRIRMEYVKGKTTYAKLAEKYHVSAGWIRKKASSERWRDRMRKLDAKTEQKTLERVSDARARELERLAGIQEKVDDFLDKAVEAFGKLEPRKYDEMRGIESLAKAINIAVQTKRDLYNIPNESERAKIESMREKNRLEREKWESEKAEKARLQAEAENTLIRVVIEGESEALDE